MNKFIRSLPLFLGVSLILAACDDRSRQPATQATPSPSATPSTTKMSDSDLEKAIRAKIESDAQLKDAKLDVDANADKNEVTISGRVRSQDMRTKAVELAKSVQSGLTVNDKIDVKPAA
jgi:osmotically-inducible protein OsmY